MDKALIIGVLIIILIVAAVAVGLYFLLKPLTNPIVNYKKYRKNGIRKLFDKKALISLLVIVLVVAIPFGYGYYRNNRWKNELDVRYIDDNRDYIYEITNNSKRTIDDVVVTFLIDVDGKNGEDFTIDKDLYSMQIGETDTCTLSAIEVKEEAEKAGITIKYVFGVELQKITYN